MAWRETADELFVRAIVKEGLLTYKSETDSTGHVIQVLSAPTQIKALADTCIEAGKIMETRKGRVR